MDNRREKWDFFVSTGLLRQGHGLFHQKGAGHGFPAAVFSGRDGEGGWFRTPIPA
jgi:hypothetical protein